MNIAGTVPFINSLPLTFYLKEHNVNISFSNPSETLNSLNLNKVDISLLPIADHLGNKNIFSLENKCISANGKVDSVIIISRGELKEIKTMFLDSRSKSSNLLVKVLFNEFVKTTPKFSYYSPSKNMILDSDCGYVVIGDLGLELTYSRPAGLKIFDLSDLWFNETALPFTFASYNYIKKPDNDLITSLENSYLKGIENIDNIVTYILDLKKVDIDKMNIETYLKERIVYEFTSKHRKGINLFLDLAKKITKIERSEFNK